MHFEEQLLTLAQVYSICSHCQAAPSKNKSCPELPIPEAVPATWLRLLRGLLWVVFCSALLVPAVPRGIALLPWALPVLTREQLGGLQVLLDASS